MSGAAQPVRPVLGAAQPVSLMSGAAVPVGRTAGVAQPVNSAVTCSRRVVKTPSRIYICDPPRDFDAKGDSTLTAR